MADEDGEVITVSATLTADASLNRDDMPEADTWQEQLLRNNPMLLYD